MMTDKLCFLLRESRLEDEVFVTVRKKERLVDYYRFPRESYNQDEAMQHLRERFRSSQLTWVPDCDDDFLKRVLSSKRLVS